MLQGESKLNEYTAFNDVLKSILILQGKDKQMMNMSDDEIKMASLSSGSIKILVDKSTKIVSQFF